MVTMGEVVTHYHGGASARASWAVTQSRVGKVLHSGHPQRTKYSIILAALQIQNKLIYNSNNIRRHQQAGKETQWDGVAFLQ